MIIANVCPKYYPELGGVETYVMELSVRLARKNFEVEVLTTDPSKNLPKEEIINGVRVKRFKSWAPNESYFFSNDLKKHLINNSDNYDIVHAHQYSTFPALYAAQSKNRNKFVFNPHYHGKGHTFIRNLLHKPYKFIGKNIFSISDKIICVSNYEKFLILKHFKINEKKFEIIPCGVNLEEFKDLKKKKKEYSSILTVCRLEKYKGVQYLIKVLPSLDQDIILEIVGKGPFKSHLVKLAKEIHVETRVKFYQNLPRNELLQKYSNADLFILLSKHESYGISVMEALASRTPCIVANTSALTEWIDDGCFGIDYPVNFYELKELITNVIGNKVLEMKFLNWDEITSKLINLYNEIC